MRRQLTLLVGAHKTASTHLQRSLTGSRSALAPHGVGVIGPMPIGADILPLSGLLRGRADASLLKLAANGFLARECGDAQNIILMNENILGTLAPNMLLQGDRFYKFSPGRIKRVLQLFEDHDVSIGMAIRSPRSFLVSAWQENMKGHPFQPFRDYIDDIDLMGLQWHRMVKRVQQAVGDIPVVVWRYEDYPAVVPSLLTRFVGTAAKDVTLLDSAANPGFSAAALGFLEDLGDVSKDNIRDALARFPKGPANPAFDPWTADESAALATLYDKDCEKLAAMDGVTLQKP